MTISKTNGTGHQCQLKTFNTDTLNSNIKHRLNSIKTLIKSDKPIKHHYDDNLGILIINDS